MNSPRPIALAALGIGAAALLFVAGRVSNDEDPNAEAPGEGGSRSGTGSLSSAPGYPSRPGKGGDSRRRDVNEVQRENQTLREQVAKLSGGAAGSSTGKVGTAQKLFEQKGLPLFDENYELSKEIAAALGLADSEYGLLTRTLKNRLDEIDTLREQSIEVRSRSDSQLFLKIRSFGEKGAEVRSSLQEDLREQLGEERYSAFMLMTEDALESEYFQFGRAYQTISFNFYNSENTGAPRIRIVDEVHIPQGDGRWTILRNKGNHDQLPEDYQTYLDVANRTAPVPSPASPGSTPSPLPTPEAPSPSPTPNDQLSN